MKIKLRVFILFLVGVSTGYSEQSRPKRFLFPLIQASLPPVITPPIITSIAVPGIVPASPAVVPAATSVVSPVPNETAIQNGAQAGFLPALVLPAPLVKAVVPTPVGNAIVPPPVVTGPLITKTVIPLPPPPPIVIPPPVVTKTVVPVVKPVLPAIVPVVKPVVIGKRRRRSADDGPFSGLTKLVRSRPELQRLHPIVFNIPPSERPTNVNIVQKLSDDSTDNTRTLTAQTSFESSSGQREGDLLIDRLRHGSSQLSTSLGDDFQKDSYVVRHHTYDVFHTDEQHDDNVDKNRYFVTNIYVTKPNGDIIPEDNTKPISTPPRPPPKIDYIEKPIEEDLPQIHFVDSIPDKSNEVSTPSRVPKIDNPYQHDRFFTTEVDLKSLGVPTLTDLVSSGSDRVEVSVPAETLSSPRSGRSGSWFDPLKKELDEVYTGATRGASEAIGEVNTLTKDLMGLEKELGRVAVSGFGQNQTGLEQQTGVEWDKGCGCPYHNQPGHMHATTHKPGVTTHKPSVPGVTTSKPARPVVTTHKPTTHKPVQTTPSGLPIPPCYTTTPPSHIGTSPRPSKPTTKPSTSHKPTTKPSTSHKPTMKPSTSHKPTKPSHVTKPTVGTIHETTTQKVKPQITLATQMPKPVHVTTHPGHPKDPKKPTHGTSPPFVPPGHPKDPKKPTHGTSPPFVPPGFTKPAGTSTTPTKKPSSPNSSTKKPIGSHQTQRTTTKKPVRPNETTKKPIDSTHVTHVGHKTTTPSSSMHGKPIPTRPTQSHKTTPSSTKKPNNSHETPKKPARPGHMHESSRPTDSLIHDSKKPKDSSFVPEIPKESVDRFNHSHEIHHSGNDANHPHGCKNKDHSHDHKNDSHKSKHAQHSRNEQPDPNTGLFLLETQQDFTKYENPYVNPSGQNPGFIDSDAPIDFAGTELKPSFFTGSDNFNTHETHSDTWENIGEEHPPAYEPADFFYVWKQKDEKDSNIFLPKESNPVEFSREPKTLPQDQPENKLITTFTITSKPSSRSGFERSEDLYRSVGDIPLESHPLDRPIISAFDSYGLPARVKK